MDFSQLVGSLQSTLGDTLPGLLGAIAILIGGWIVAIIVRAGFRRGLAAAGLNERTQGATGSAMNLEKGVSTGAYYVVLLVVLAAFFNALQLDAVSGTFKSLVDQVFAYAPKLISGGVLLLVAWLLATVVRTLVTSALGATTLDDRLSTEAGMRPMSESLGQVLFWLIVLLFLPAILGALEIHGLLDPVQGMVDQLLAMLPNILAATAIGAVGWFLARILRDLVSNLLSAAGADGLGERAGLRGTMTLSALGGLLVYVFVLVPAVIQALNTLQIEAISAPATEMLSSFMAAIPNVFGAAIILAVAWFVSGFVASLSSSLLGGVGFDTLPDKLGLAGAFEEGQSTPSDLAGKIIVFFIMLFATVEAAGRLGFAQVSALVTTLIAFGGQVLLGVVIIAVGFWISNLAHAAIQRVSGEESASMANLARFAILGIVLAMGLRAMGLADDIVNLAFGLTLGSIAVAVALSFGLGGREAAGKQMEHWLANLRGDSSSPTDKR